MARPQSRKTKEEQPSHQSSVATPERLILRLALGLSFGFLVLRLGAAESLGFGDAEALYISYSLHPQPGYLDHPGLIGSIARLVSDATPPTPFRIHMFTAVAATLLPWLGGLCARGLGANLRGVLTTVFALALMPQISVGLFGLTPDLPLAYAWLGALGLAGLALQAEPASSAARMGWLGAGLMLSVAITSKASGVVLAASIFATLLSGPARAHRRTVWPSMGGVIMLVGIWPLLAWEVQQDYPMLRHRLFATQADAGLSFRSLGVLVGGQLLYVTPPFLIGAWLVGKELFRRRRSDDAVDRLLWIATILPGVVLSAFILWSPVSEPHWLAPAFLSLAIQAGRGDVLSVLGKYRRLKASALAVGVAFPILATLWVASPAPMQLLGDRYEPKWDVGNDMHAWLSGAKVLQESITAARVSTGTTPIIVAPHWIVCAQIRATLGDYPPIACQTEIGDDFQRFWAPPGDWRDAPVLLYVHDSRFEVDPQGAFPDRTMVERRRVPVLRGGRVIRTIFVTRLDKGSRTATKAF